MTPRDTRDEVEYLMERALRAPSWPDCLAFIHEALALLRSPETQERGWQDIKRSPKDGTSVLIVVQRGAQRFVGEARYFNRDDSDCGWWWAGEDPGDYHASRIGDAVTHWMPLPSPPAQTEDR